MCCRQMRPYEYRQVSPQWGGGGIGSRVGCLFQHPEEVGDEREKREKRRFKLTGAEW